MPVFRGRVTLTALLVSLLLACPACAPRPDSGAGEGVQEIAGATMGTVYQVRVVVEPSRRAEIREALSRELVRVNQEMSVFDPASEISRFNQSRSADQWVPVSASLARVVGVAQSISDRSGGGYDVTLGPLIRLWGFGPDGPRDDCPSQEEIDTYRERVGWTRLKARQEPPALLKTHPDLEVNLSSLAKGEGVDRVALRLERLGLRHYVVEIGGEIRTQGRHPSGRPWRIGIARPVPGVTGVYRVVQAGKLAMATSGDYRNFFSLGGKTFSHTLDPATGRPVTRPHASVTVLHERCVVADGWATALSVLSLARARQVAQEEQLAVLILERREGGAIEAWESPSFALLAQNSLSGP